MTEMEQWKEQAVDWEIGQAALNSMIAMLGQTEQENNRENWVAKLQNSRVIQIVSNAR